MFVLMMKDQKLIALIDDLKSEFAQFIMKMWNCLQSGIILLELLNRITEGQGNSS